jgi:hemoglobin-like flavoprotein
MDMEALETSFDLVAPRGDELMRIFYARLFATAPAVRALFPDDMRPQQAKLLAALVLVRKSLRDMEAIVPTLRALGAKHAGYGAEAAHYGVVAAVLIAAMAEVAGDAWRPEYEQAWSEALGFIAAVMIEGAEAELAVAA